MPSLATQRMTYFTPLERNTALHIRHSIDNTPRTRSHADVHVGVSTAIDRLPETRAAFDRHSGTWGNTVAQSITFDKHKTRAKFRQRATELPDACARFDSSTCAPMLCIGEPASLRQPTAANR